MRTVLFLLALAGAAAAEKPVAQGPAAEQIMRKVAWHQNRAQTMREAFRFEQSVLIRFHKGKKLVREEAFEYVVRPTARGTEKERTRFLGQYRYKGELHPYYDPDWEASDVDIDGELITDIAEDLTNDKDSKDGIEKDLFPLTMQEQKDKVFTLKGRESYKGREVYRIEFEPVKKSWGDGVPWAGEALIDVEKLQPVLVTTYMAKGLPAAVKVLLGTNISQLGFKVTYEEFEDDLWFPVTYGGEFSVRGVFFYKRNISISLRNSGFERAEVTSRIAFEDQPAGGLDTEGTGNTEVGRD
jgi:hypothetical protein